ncbi:MAG: YceI family protein [Bacteroidota bacterium]
MEILIDCKSLHHDWEDLKKSIKKKKDYFYVSKFPTATASVQGAEKMEDGSYGATMVLSLKGITKEVPITFTVTGNGTETDPYKVTGAGELNRRKFNFKGKGPKNEVPLRFEIVLP